VSDVGENYLVWSNEHMAWWGSRRVGYVESLRKAGRYTYEEAMDICVGAAPGAHLIGSLPELPVRESDAVTLRYRFRLKYPNAPAEAWE
jgi:hypothetical protein